MEERVQYLLKPYAKHDTLEPEQQRAVLIDLVQLERMLLPVLNQVRKAQGKRPVIVPKG